MNYLLDTNILLIYMRDKQTREFIEAQYDPFGAQNNPIISIVTVGEIKSIALRNNWGLKRIDRLMSMMNELIVTDINSEDVVNRYAEIETYSQNKLKGNPLPVSARNMGKNDLWIAATASVTDSRLLTTDSDFEHLNKTYLDLVKIKI